MRELRGEKTAAVTIEIKLYCGYCVNQLVTCNECQCDCVIAFFLPTC